MVERPPQPEHFASAPPPRAPHVRRNVLVGLAAALLVAGALAGAFMAHRSRVSVVAQPDPETAAHRAAALARQSEMRRVSRQVEEIKKRMHALAVEAGVASALPPAAPEAGASP